MMITTTEESPLLIHLSGNLPTTWKTYWYRWYILILYGLYTSFQTAVWNTWGPISDSMKFAYDWDNMTLSLLPFWGLATYVLSFYPFTECLYRYGLSFSSRLSVLLMLVGCGLKCIPLQGANFKMLCHGCAILNGLAGPVSSCAVTTIASSWFPRNERVMATALGTAFASFGTAYSFLIPLIVPDVDDAFKNHTNPIYNSSDAVKDMKMRIVSRVNILNWSEFGVSALLMFFFLAFYPSKPPSPPSISSEVERMNVASGFISLSLNTWCVMLAYGLSMGVNTAFSSIFSLNVSNFGIGEDEAGWVGFISTMVGTLMSFVAARLVDLFPNAKMALINFVLLFISFLGYLWFTLMCEGILPINTIFIYASNIIANAAILSTAPLFYDLSCEAAFPISETVPSAVLTTILNFICGVFLIPFFFPLKNTLWMNYAMAGSCFLSLPLMLLFKENHYRRTVDLTDGAGVIVVHEDIVNVTSVNA